MGVQVNSYFKSKYTGAEIENALDAFGNTASAYDSATSYTVGDLCLHNNTLYVCTGATTGAFDPTKWQQTTLAELVENLGATYTDPNNDGNVVVGIDSTTGTKTIKSISFPTLTNKYVFPFAQYIRTDASNDPDNASFDVEIPDAEEAPMHSTVIKGKTVAVNQLVENGNFADTSGWTFYTASVTASGNVATVTASATGGGLVRGVSVITGHKYLCRSFIKLSSANTSVGISFFDNAYCVASTDWQEVAAIQTSNTTGSRNMFALRDFRTSGWDSSQTRNTIVIDLNNSPVANRLAEIGTDVAKLKQVWLEEKGEPLPQYIPYDAGSLANADGEYRMRGRNIWDEEWELGRLNAATGLNEASTTDIRSKNYVPCKEGESIYTYLPNYTGTNRIAFYDANKNFLGASGWFGLANGQTRIVPAQARFFRFYVNATTYNYDICINLSDASFNGQYEKYFDGGTIDCSTAPLNGVGTAQDVKDFATGERTDRTKKDDFSDLSWTYNSGASRWQAALSDAKSVGTSDVINGIHSLYPVVSLTTLNSDTSLNCVAVYNGTVYCRNGSTSVSPTGDFCYELATPVTTTETPQPIETQYGYNCFEPISGGVQSAEVNLTYYENIAGYIDKKIGA